MSPESVLTDALLARVEWRYKDVVRLVDPATQEERFRHFCDMVRPMTLERFAEQFPEIEPGELTSRFARWSERTAYLTEAIPRSLAGITTYDEVAALTPHEFLVRWLENEDPRGEIMKRLRARGRSVPASLFECPAGQAFVTIGSVYERDDLVHVLYRVTQHSPDGTSMPGSVEFESLRRQDDGSWRLLMDQTSFLGPRGSTITILDDQFDDLWSSETNVEDASQ